jgi:hypothetical protein
MSYIGPILGAWSMRFERIHQISNLFNSSETYVENGEYFHLINEKLIK